MIPGRAQDHPPGKKFDGKRTYNYM